MTSEASGAGAAPAGDGTARPPSAAGVALRTWVRAYRVELGLFALVFLAYASFSGPRFLRQSAAPHFVYQAKAFLDGRLDLDPETLPNLEDWACVRTQPPVGDAPARKLRCTGAPRTDDRWYVSFPPFPAVLMLPFVALHGWQFNDTSFAVILGALAVALFHGVLRRLAQRGELARTPDECIGLSLVLAFGTLLFSCAIRGEVWFLAEVMGVGLTCLYLRAAVGAAHPLAAGALWSTATLTRTPLVFTGLFFLLEAVTPGPTGRLAQLRAAVRAPRTVLRPLVLFAAGAAPLALLAAAFNWARFGSPGEFGHRFLYENRVNVDIDAHGLFSPVYLARNLEAAFLLLPRVQLSPLRLGYDPRGLSLLVTMPWLVLLLAPGGWRRAAGTLTPEGPAAGAPASGTARLQWPLWLTVAVTALPGLFYQNTGYMQFGFRFSLDYLPYLVLLLGLTRWSSRSVLARALVVAAILVNTWGALAFRGYTELVRRM